MHMNAVLISVVERNVFHLEQQLRGLFGWTWPLSGTGHGASVWNDVEGQTGDCGCRVSITSEGTKAPVCHLRRDTPLSLHFIPLTGKMC